MGDPKRRKGWDPVGTKTKEWFSTDDVKKIIDENYVPLKAGAEKELESVTEKLDRIAADFCDSIDIIQKGPSIPEIRAALKDINKKAAGLLQSMEELDYSGYQEHRFKKQPCLHKRESRLAYLRRFCSDTCQQSQGSVCPRTTWHRPEIHCVCFGFNNHRSLHESIPMGSFTHS